MKNILIAVIMFASCEFALADEIRHNIDTENVDLFLAGWSEVRIPSQSVKEKMDNVDFVDIVVVRPKEKLGHFFLEKEKLQQIYTRSLGHDSSNEPLIGRGVSLIARTSDGQWFSIFYERHTDNPKALNDKRIVLKKLLIINDDDKPLLTYATNNAGISYANELIGSIRKLLIKHFK